MTDSHKSHKDFDREDLKRKKIEKKKALNLRKKRKQKNEERK